MKFPLAPFPWFFLSLSLSRAASGIYPRSKSWSFAMLRENQCQLGRSPTTSRESMSTWSFTNDSESVDGSGEHWQRLLLNWERVPSLSYHVKRGWSDALPYHFRFVIHILDVNGRDGLRHRWALLLWTIADFAKIAVYHPDIPAWLKIHQHEQPTPLMSHPSRFIKKNYRSH